MCKLKYAGNRCEFVLQLQPSCVPPHLNSPQIIIVATPTLNERVCVCFCACVSARNVRQYHPKCVLALGYQLLAGGSACKLAAKVVAKGRSEEKSHCQSKRNANNASGCSLNLFSLIVKEIPIRNLFGISKSIPNSNRGQQRHEYGWLRIAADDQRRY